MNVAGCFKHGGLSVGPCPICKREGVQKLAPVKRHRLRRPLVLAALLFVAWRLLEDTTEALDWNLAPQ